MTPAQMQFYRNETEAREVLSWDFVERRPYLDLVEKKRGKAARATLEREMIRQHREKK